LTGQATFDEHDLEKAKQKLRSAANAIRANDFHAEPNEFVCHWCAFQAICPSAFRAK
jgi:hypothetical protein